MNKTVSFIPLFVGIALAIGFYLGSRQKPIQTFTPNQSSETDKVYNAQMKFMRVVDLLKEEYVDTVDQTKMVEGAIEQMLTSLDPHSAYLPFEVNQREEEQLRGNFAGVGVKFMILKDTLTVTNVIKGGPSYLAGVQNGDRIIKIDTNDIASEVITNEDVMKQLKGPPGTTVNLTIKRGDKVVSHQVTRGTIPIYSVTGSFMLQPKVGYIKLSRFSETSYREFVFAAQKLLSKGMTHLVFDLRANGGGYLNIAHQIVDEFLEAGKMVVYTKDKVGTRDVYESSNRGILKNTKVSILIDSESASASEIVAGAIQDNDRGKIYGRRSFGKGLVQKPIMLQDSSLVRITVARYYTPTGRCIQKEYNGNYQDYMMELYDRDKNGELFALDSSYFVDSLKFTTPAGNVVYGGGGISPDVFIPYDTTGFSAYYRNLSYSRVFSEFAIQYLDVNRSKWSVSSLNYFVKNFKVTDKLFKSFIDYAESREIKPVAADINHSRERIKERLKESIASNIWDDEGRLYINAPVDSDVQGVLEDVR